MLRRVLTTNLRAHTPSLRLCNQSRISRISTLPTSTWAADCIAPVCAVENLLISLHGHLPWWGSIACSAIILRASVTLPVAVFQLRLRSKIDTLTPHIRALAFAIRERVHRKYAGKLSRKDLEKQTIKEYKHNINKIYWEAKAHPYLCTLCVGGQKGAYVNSACSAVCADSHFCYSVCSITSISWSWWEYAISRLCNRRCVMVHELVSTR